MRAAVIYEGGTMPQYTTIDEPTPENENEILVSVRAVSVKHLDKSRAGGKHYSSDKPKQGMQVPGGDGVFLLPDGKRAYGIAASGMMAEKAIVEKDKIVLLPDDIDDATAAALPNAVIGAAMALKFKADIQPGDVVLINGATGFTGRVALQIAKYYGAGTVIVTGRNPQSLQKLLALGASITVPLTQTDDDFKQQLKAIHADTPINVVIDYLWGHSAEMILDCIKGDGSFTHQTRYVSVGSMAGDLINLSAATLRSVNIQLSGSGLGAWTKQQVQLLLKEILPEMFRLAAGGQLKIDTVQAKLEDINKLWDMDIPNGQRLVITI